MSRGWRVGAGLLSGVLVCFATGLEPWWWAAWLAPVPIASGLLMRVRGLISGLVVARTRAVALGSRHWLMAFVYPALMAGLDTPRRRRRSSST